MAEVSVLRLTRTEHDMRRSWNRLWKQIRDRLLRLPRREQAILLEDFRTAIESRLVAMERITNKQR